MNETCYYLSLGTLAMVALYAVHLHRKAARAEAENNEKAKLIAHLNHALRTPLTTLSGIAEIFELSQDGLDANQKQLVVTLKSAVEALKKILRGIPDFSGKGGEKGDAPKT